jgi:hypothetical protein
MTETKFAMMSEWMSNGNINEFVTAHQDANWFELVGCPFKLWQPSPVVANYVVPVVGRRRKGLDLHARSENGPWGPQRGASSELDRVFLFNGSIC